LKSPKDSQATDGEAKFIHNPKYLKLLLLKEPIPVSGKVAINEPREVAWKNVCIIGH
jgi:hypothetical protein